MASTDIYADLQRLDQLVHDGESFFYHGRSPDNRIMAMSSTGAMLLMPDPETGIPSFPTVGMMRTAQLEHRLVIRSRTLDDPVRADARAEEATPAEVEERDGWAPLRRRVVKAWDREPDDAKPMLSDTGLTEWFKLIFDEAETIARHGRLPCGTTMRTWFKTRGRSRDRRMVDMESRSGKVKRSRRFPDLTIAIARLHALACNARKGRKVNLHYGRFKADLKAAAKGEEIEVDGIVFDYERPSTELKPFSVEIFRRECLKAKSAATLEAAVNAKARQALFGGGGPAKEPTRFMECVEQDDTPFAKYFLIDPYNRVPVGPATVVFSVDVFTHCIVGWEVSFDSPSLTTWMRAVAHVAEPKEVPKRLRERFPGLADVFGYVVGHYIFDNALQNVAKAVEDAGGDLCHEVRLAGEGEPTHKPHVERIIQTMTSYLAEVPGSSWGIPLMRKYGYDPEKHVVITIEEFRVLLAEAIATYHTQKSKALNDRAPLDVWQEQVRLHGHSQARDHDQFLRSMGDVDYLTFSRTGCDKNYLDYSDGAGNEDLLADCAIALGASKNTVNPSWVLKVKSYPDNVGFVSVFNPLTRRYVHVPCTKRRYSHDMPLWLHLRNRDHAAELGLAFATEEEMEASLIGLQTVIEDITPEATKRQRKTMARLFDRPMVQRYLGDSLQFMRVDPSPSGLENDVVEHDVRAATRRDAHVEPQRRRRGGANVDRDRREAGKEREATSKAAAQARGAGAGRRRPARSAVGKQGLDRTIRAKATSSARRRVASSVAPLTTTPFK